MPLPHWANNPFYGPISDPWDLEGYSDDEEPSDTELI